LTLDYLRLYAGLDGLSERAVAILPLGAVETHGPHLPLGTDSLLAERLLDWALTDWTLGPPDLLRLPSLWVAASGEHDRGRGTLALEAGQTIAAIEALGGQLAKNGIRRLLLFNAHGGNIAAGQVAALNLRRRHGQLVAAAHWLDFGLPPDFDPPSPPEQDVHGGWMETSLLLHLQPETVRRDRLAARPPQPPAASLFPSGPIAWGWSTQDLGPDTWIGFPERASAAIGRQMTDHIGSGLRRLLQELSAADWEPLP